LILSIERLEIKNPQENLKREAQINLKKFQFLAQERFRDQRMKEKEHQRILTGLRKNGTRDLLKLPMRPRN